MSWTSLKACTNRVAWVVAPVVAPVLVLALILGLVMWWPAWPAPVRPDPRDAIGYLATGCTAEFITPRVLLTAAHCVTSPWMWGTRYLLGETVEVVFTRTDETRTRMQARVVWVSPLHPMIQRMRQDPRPLADANEGLDIAFLVADDPSPFVLAIGKDPPRPGQRVRNISMALGLQYWTVDLVVSGVYDLIGLGRVVVVRGDTGPGASGSVLLDQHGRIVGMVTHGTRGLLMPPLHVGATANRIRWALDDYVRYGRMVPCGQVIIGQSVGPFRWLEAEPKVCRERP